FIGRNREMREILSRVATMQSVSIYGERLIGKSSLLHHLVATGRQRLGEQVDFFYLDLQPLNSAAEFYTQACKAINGKTYDADDEFAHDDLRAAIDGRQVVLCLDEFEQTIESDFGAEFFNVLRSLAQTGNLALVIATKRRLSEIYRQEDALTSSFSNIFTPLPLGPLSEAEVEEFLQAAHNGFTFSKDERDLIRRIAGTHPYWLNAACAKVFEARQLGQMNFDEIERRLRAERDAAEAPASQPQPESPQPAPAPLPAAEPKSKFKWAAPDPDSVYLRALVLFIIGLTIAKFSSDSVGILFAAFFIGGSIFLALNYDLSISKRQP
ncbi:MAG: AAA family ATPase, partial [Blastocatellia bacterium]